MPEAPPTETRPIPPAPANNKQQKQKQQKQQKSPLGAWTGVAVDLALTVLLVALGIDPVFALVEAHRLEAAIALCAGHTIVVPAGMLVGLIRSDELELIDGRTRMGKVMNAAFLLFCMLGWMLPLAVVAVSPRVPGALFMASIFAHVVPIAALVLLSLLRLEKSLDRFAEWLAGRSGARVLAFVFAAYLAGVEVFLILLRTGRRSAAEMALPIWLLAYVPTRLLLARLTGLRGPEVWTFALSNLHLLARLLLAVAE
jgi:hypothetical protein